jgi:hypothetical protein
MTGFAKGAFYMAVGCFAVSAVTYGLNEAAIAFNVSSSPYTTFGKIPLHEAPKAFLAIGLAVTGVGAIGEVAIRIKNGILNSLSR